MLDPFSFLLGFVSFPTLLYLGVAILLTVEVAYDLGWLASITAAVFGALGWWNGWFSIDSLSQHWFEVVMGIGLYVLGGIFWAIVKWWFFIHAEARKMRARIASGFATYVTVPQVTNHKSDIMRWLCWWPFSMVGTMLNDPFRRLFEAIYRELGTFLQQMADRAFANITVPERPKSGTQM